MNKMHQFSICYHCNNVVDMKDTFRDNCIDCGLPAHWVDDREELDRIVAARNRQVEESKDEDE